MCHHNVLGPQPSFLSFSSLLFTPMFFLNMLPLKKSSNLRGQDKSQAHDNGVVLDDPKLPYDNGELPKLYEVVGSLIPSRDIVSLLDGKLARWSSASCIPKKKRNKTTEFFFFHIPISNIGLLLSRGVVLTFYSVCGQVGTTNIKVLKRLLKRH